MQSSNVQPKVEKSTTKVEKSTTKVIAGSTFTASAYSTHENGDKYVARKWGGKTATGTTPVQGRTIAVDPDVIPLGTKVNIDFPAPFDYMDGSYIAEDTGNAIQGNRVDIYFDSVKVALNFGHRDIKVNY